LGKDIDLEISGMYGWNEVELSKLAETASGHILPFVGSVKHFSSSTKTASLSMFVYPVRKEVLLTIGTNSEELPEAKKIFGVLISALALVPATAGKALGGEARRYFIEDSIDEKWFNKLGM
jgi:hypothetical protein